MGWTTLGMLVDRAPFTVETKTAEDAEATVE
jgi:hypothetical protein